MVWWQHSKWHWLRNQQKGKKNYSTIAPATRSDRGIQYCSKQYTSLLIDNEVVISMTRKGESSENQIAERINRTIKEEILENRSFFSYQHAFEEIEKAIKSYNWLHPTQVVII